MTEQPENLDNPATAGGDLHDDGTQQVNVTGADPADITEADPEDDQVPDETTERVEQDRPDTGDDTTTDC